MAYTQPINRGFTRNPLRYYPNWTQEKEALDRQGKDFQSYEGEGIRIFRNAVNYIRSALEKGILR